MELSNTNNTTASIQYFVEGHGQEVRAADMWSRDRISDRVMGVFMREKTLLLHLALAEGGGLLLTL